MTENNMTNRIAFAILPHYFELIDGIVCVGTYNKETDRGTDMIQIGKLDELFESLPDDFHKKRLSDSEDHSKFVFVIEMWWINSKAAQEYLSSVK